MRTITMFLAGLLAMYAPSVAAPGTQVWDYKDWTVAVEAVDTGEDLRITCRAWTGGDGQPRLVIEVSNGDALPPHHYPLPHLYESAPRGHRTMLFDGAWVMFEVDVLVEPDLPWRAEGEAQAWYDDDGILQAVARPFGDGLDLLAVMREAGTLWVTLDSEVVYAASLSGFTAAYGKMAEQCGFPTVGVID